MKEANLNVDGVTPLMHNALIAQYDAIKAAVPQWDVIGPSANDSPASEAFRDGWLIGWKAHLILTLDAIANHDPRKGAE